MGATRAVVWALGLAGLTLLPACRRAAAEAVPEDGVLVLELGGDAPSLREALKARGVVFEPEPQPVVEPEPPPPKPEPEPVVPGPDPEPRPEAEFFTVDLKKGETLWDLAREHLGKGTRWNEILTLNGWTEAQARRLRAGTPVRIPRQ